MNFLFVPLSTYLSSSLEERILKEYMLNLQKSENLQTMGN